MKHALTKEDSNAWKEAMASEVNSLIKHKTCTLVKRNEKQRVIDSRFIFRNKHDSNGKTGKRKARVIARGFSQRPGVDYHDTFAPVAKLDFIRTAIAVAAERDMMMKQIDIGTAYLNGDVHEEILMKVPNHLESILEHIIENELESTIRSEAKKMLTSQRQHGLFFEENFVWIETSGSPSDADLCIYH